MNDYNYAYDLYNYDRAGGNNYMYGNTSYIPNSMNNNLYSATDGLAHGNMFISLYKPYKNYEFNTLSSNDERNQLLIKIDEASFAAHDLNLYLDLNPNDTAMIKLFNDYKNQAMELSNQYEAKYGPLTLNSNVTNTTVWTWNNNPWPWEIM